MLAKLREARLLWPLVMTAAAMAILLSLGKWQLDRRVWKEGLIAAIEARTKEEPVDLLSAYSATYQSDLGFEYMRVKVRGRFHHDKERYLYAPDPELGPGYHVYTPFEVEEGGGILFVNRGYVPEALKSADRRPQGQLDGEVEVTGLLRAPGLQGFFTPDNDPKRNLWYWRDYYGLLASAFGDTSQPHIAAFLDAEGPAPGGWPKGSATIVELPNRHLEYALTWFGLAGALAVVFAVYAVSRLKAPATGQG